MTNETIDGQGPRPESSAGPVVAQRFRVLAGVAFVTAVLLGAVTADLATGSGARVELAVTDGTSNT